MNKFVCLWVFLQHEIYAMSQKKWKGEGIGNQEPIQY